MKISTALKSLLFGYLILKGEINDPVAILPIYLVIFTESVGR